MLRRRRGHRACNFCGKITLCEREGGPRNQNKEILDLAELDLTVSQQEHTRYSLEKDCDLECKFYPASHRFFEYTSSSIWRCISCCAGPAQRESAYSSAFFTFPQVFHWSNKLAIVTSRVNPTALALLVSLRLSRIQTTRSCTLALHSYDKQTQSTICLDFGSLLHQNVRGGSFPVSLSFHDPASPIFLSFFLVRSCCIIYLFFVQSSADICRLACISPPVDNVSESRRFHPR